MSDRVDVAVVGAGPFGLSVAAWLGRDLSTRVFGQPMQTWRTMMPPDMLMRSAWDETSISAPRGGTIDDWAAACDELKTEPIPLQMFLRYADWFRKQFVPDHVTSDVAAVEHIGDGFLVRTESGDEVEAGTIVIAVGVTPFTVAPEALEPFVGDGADFAIAQRDFSELAGKRCLVVGAGQAGLESAGLAARAGADVEVVARSGVRWFADHEPHHERSPVRQRLYRLAYPVVGYGPPPINRLVLYPDVFAALPLATRRRLTERLLRPGGSPWVRGLVEGKVRITQGCGVRTAERRGGEVVVHLTDGSERRADLVLIATGYRFSLERLRFLALDVGRGIALRHGWPVLDRWFRSTDPRILLVGYPAEGRFGPLSRFVLGTEFTSRRVWSGLVRRGAAAVAAATAPGR